MTESGFEARLARSLLEMADDGLRPFDPRAVAEAVVATRRGSLGTARWLMTREGRRLIWLAAAAALLLLAALIALALLGSRAPTSERLAFVRNGDIWVAYADGRDARLLVAHDVTGPDLGGCTGVHWSPDGSRLAAPDINAGAVGKRRITILTADGAPLGSFDIEVGPHGPAALAWSPDGAHLAVLVANLPTGGLWLYDDHGRLEREVGLPPAYRAAMPMDISSVSWSPDGRYLAITGCPCGAENTGSWILAVDGSGARRITPPGQGSALSLAWSPDGMRLAIGSGTWVRPGDPGTPGELWLVGVDGGPAKRIATRVEMLIVNGWSSDGTWISFAEPSSLDVVRADGSGEPLRLGPGSQAMHWSEDQRLFYLAAPNVPGGDSPSDWQGIGSIMVVEPAGGEPAVVIDGVDAHAPFDIAKPPPPGSPPLP